MESDKRNQISKNSARERVKREKRSKTKQNGSYNQIILTLFIGRNGKVERGGRKIFVAIYDKFACFEKKLIDYDFRNISLISYTRAVLDFTFDFLKNMFKYKRAKCIVTQYNELLEILPSLVLRLLNKDLILVGTLYHLDKKKFSKKQRSKFLQQILYLDHKLSTFLELKLYNIILTENRAMEEYIKNKSEAYVIVQNPGVKKIDIPQDIERLTQNDRDIDVLFVGAMEEKKGLYDLLSSWANVFSSMKCGSKLVLAGYVSEYDLRVINEYISQNNLSGVEIFANVTNEMKYRLYKRAKVCALPSLFDGIPLTFQEAMVSGTLILTYEIEAFRDLTRNIITVEPGNTKALSTKLSEILEHYDEYKEFYVTRNYMFAAEHSFESVVGNIVSEICQQL